MRILIPSDVLPPRCGGSSWSTYYLVKALQKRCHEIEVIVPKPGLNGISFGTGASSKISCLVTFPKDLT